MIPFICVTCGSLCVVTDEREGTNTIHILHPTNVACASRTNLQNGTLRARRYLELSAFVNISGNPDVSIT